VDVEVLAHPIVVRPLEGAERVHALAPDDVDEKTLGFIEVGNREPDVLDTA
jgi:hypothetical protein